MNAEELEGDSKKAYEFGRRVAEAEDRNDSEGRREARAEWVHFWKKHWRTERHQEIMNAYLWGRL